ncbi:MAG TPA: endo alpha-1,4 polygalactosaminidase, partial [Polyangiaceae bacterium]|nr:endo alpha-1,4 polygalactosaminidase [Polyangiaceae bacterium]
FSRLWSVAMAIFVTTGVARSARADERPHVSTAFYYGAGVPSELLAHFDRVVVEPDAVPSLPSSSRAQLFAYVSVGEVNPGCSYRADVPARLIVGSNPVWGSQLVDTRADAWRQFLLERVVDPLYARGFRGLFLDTLDSYERLATDARERAAYARAIASIVEALRRRHPDVKLLMNRGFDVLPLLTQPPDGLVVESLFETAEPAGEYHQVATPERNALLRILQRVRERWNLPITVIDYVPGTDRSLRRHIANLIWQSGFDPYVTTPSLTSIGVGRVEIVPRRILLLYKNHPDEGYLGQQDACVLVAPILEWMGYAVDYVDVTGPLPSGDIAGRYAGVVVLAPEGVDGVKAYRAWLVRLMEAGVRIAFLDAFGFDADSPFLDRLGLEAAKTTTKGPLKLASTSAYVGFEANVRARTHELPPVRSKSDSVRSYLRIEDAEGETWDGVVIGPWGGAAFAPYVLSEDLAQERRWILDPFRFLYDALALEPILAPDVTTESGRRILTVHVDGDAFVSHTERRGNPFAGEVVLDEILRRYPIPQTVSIVEGEIGPTGLYPADSPHLEAIARQIFALPYVEIGSHTYSHPFDWADAESGKITSPPANLPIPGYKFDRNREIRGSINYINSRLAPAGKSVRVLQWSGDCSPSLKAVELADEAGVLNINGGGTTRTRDFPSLTRGSAMGIPKGDGVYQVFAPVENEYVYTNEWHGPYYGYDRVIETFELNEQPRRLSIISIYYHFYSGIKTASLEALRRVYDWALAQETTKLYVSEYAAKVRDFQSVSFGRRVDDGGWEVAGLGELRTLRVDDAWGWPDLTRSSGVAGVRDTPQGRYLHLVRDSTPVIYPSVNPPFGPYLQQANGRVLHWELAQGGAKLRIAGAEPLVVEVVSSRPCTLKTPRRTITVAPLAGVVRLALPERDTEEATLDCR